MAKLKQKTNRGAAKRFKVKANGRITHRHAFRNHILTKKTSKLKRQLRATGAIDASDTKSICRLLRLC